MNFAVPVVSVRTVAIAVPGNPFGSGVDIAIGWFGIGVPEIENDTLAEVIAGFGEYDGTGVGVAGFPEMPFTL